MTGKRPVGYRAPSWKFSGWTMGQVKAAGFLYDSSLMASDDAYELLLDGQPTGHRGAADRAHPGRLPVLRRQRRRLEPLARATSTRSSSRSSTWPTRKAVLYLLTMHPHLMGHRSRAAMLERLVAHMKGKPGVWFATHEEIARHVRESGSRIS